jgi:archaemetzincin
MARICLLALALLVAAPSAARADDGVVTIHVVPIGPVPADLLEEMSRALRLEYAAEVVHDKPLALPARGQGTERHHRAEQLLTLLGQRLPVDVRPGVRVLGVTAADLWAADSQGDRSVSGAAEQRGHIAVVSTFGLRHPARGRAQLALRLSTTAVHHLGHTFGLTHCGEDRCAMLDRPENADTATAAAGTRLLTRHLGWGCRGQLVSATSP